MNADILNWIHREWINRLQICIINNGRYIAPVLWKRGKKVSPSCSWL